MHVTSYIQVYVMALCLYEWCLMGLCFGVNMFILNYDNGIDQKC